MLILCPKSSVYIKIFRSQKDSASSQLSGLSPHALPNRGCPYSNQVPPHPLCAYRDALRPRPPQTTGRRLGRQNNNYRLKSIVVRRPCCQQAVGNVKRFSFFLKIYRATAVLSFDSVLFGNSNQRRNQFRIDFLFQECAAFGAGGLILKIIRLFSHLW